MTISTVCEAEQFFFYRIPKVLFTERNGSEAFPQKPRCSTVCLDRMSLSCKNGWLDKEGRVYIIFTIEEVMTALGCADQKAGKLLHELESKCRSSSAAAGQAQPHLRQNLWIRMWITHRAAPRPPRNHEVVILIRIILI